MSGTLFRSRDDLAFDSKLYRFEVVERPEVGILLGTPSRPLTAGGTEDGGGGDGGSNKATDASQSVAELSRSTAGVVSGGEDPVRGFCEVDFALLAEDDAFCVRHPFHLFDDQGHQAGQVRLLLCFDVFVIVLLLPPTLHSTTHPVHPLAKRGQIWLTVKCTLARRGSTLDRMVRLTPRLSLPGLSESAMRAAAEMATVRGRRQRRQEQRSWEDSGDEAVGGGGVGSLYGVQPDRWSSDDSSWTPSYDESEGSDGAGGDRMAGECAVEASSVAGTGASQSGVGPSGVEHEATDGGGRTLWTRAAISAVAWLIWMPVELGAAAIAPWVLFDASSAYDADGYRAAGRVVAAMAWAGQAVLVAAWLGIAWWWTWLVVDAAGGTSWPRTFMLALALTVAVRAGDVMSNGGGGGDGGGGARWTLVDYRRIAGAGVRLLTGAVSAICMVAVLALIVRVPQLADRIRHPVSHPSSFLFFAALTVVESIVAIATAPLQAAVVLLGKVDNLQGRQETFLQSRHRLVTQSAGSLVDVAIATLSRPLAMVSSEVAAVEASVASGEVAASERTRRRSAAIQSVAPWLWRGFGWVASTGRVVAMGVAQAVVWLAVTVVWGLGGSAAVTAAGLVATVASVVSEVVGAVLAPSVEALEARAEGPASACGGAVVAVVRLAFAASLLLGSLPLSALYRLARLLEALLLDTNKTG